MEIIGWIGALCLSFCALPLAVRAFEDGHAEGVDEKFLWMWMVGEVAMFVYVWPIGSWALITNYGFNVALIGFILIQKYKPDF